MRTKQKFPHSEEVYSKFLRLLPDPITIITLSEGRYVDVNDGYLRATGYRRKEVIGRTGLELNFWPGPEARAEIVRKLRKRGLVSDLEISFRTRSGELHVGLASAGIIYLSGEPCILGLSRDITERKRTEAKLFELASIVKSSDDAIIGGTLEGLITSWNRGAAKMYGYSAEEVKGRSGSILVPPDRSNEFPHILERIRKGETFEPFKTVRVRKDGQRIDVSVTVSPIRNARARLRVPQSLRGTFPSANGRRRSCAGHTRIRKARGGTDCRPFKNQDAP